MKADKIKVPKPNIDNDLGLSCGVEPLHVEHLLSRSPFKAFVTSICPRRAWIDLHRFDPNLLQTVADALK